MEGTELQAALLSPRVWGRPLQFLEMKRQEAQASQVQERGVEVKGGKEGDERRG